MFYPAILSWNVSVNMKCFDLSDVTMIIKQNIISRNFDNMF